MTTTRALALFAAVSLVAATHYEKPPCGSDEVQANLQGGGTLCAPSCTSQTCPTDPPAGTTAKPQCVLQDAGSGKKYCGLVCTSNSQCGTEGATCSMVGAGMGICTYPSGSKGADVAFTVEGLFKEFMEKFAKSYENAEERAKRIEIFAENLGEIARLQVADPSAEYSYLTPFADWSQEEFLARNGLKPELMPQEMPQAETLSVKDLPSSFDWREKGAVNKVKNQQQCGSCWAFATVANVEGVNFLKTKTLLSLSEQELVDCDKKTGDQGCQGGLPTNAMKDMAENKIGLETEEAYPYAAKNGQCQATSDKEKVFIGGFKQISTDEDQIAAALVQYGPLAIGINAGPMQFYHGGVAKPWKILCNPKKLDHGVAIVGFGEDAGTKYWIIRNSWGEVWGEKGYYRIVRGTGACGLNTMVATATMNATATGDIIV